MAAKIGILGEVTITDTVLNTIYTVPADKSARIRVQFELQVGALYTYSILIGSPGGEIALHFVGAAGQDMWSGMRAETTPNPADSTLISTQGIQQEGALVAISFTDLANLNEWYMMPFAADYFLSTGDTVKCKASVSFNSNLCQVVGVEDDA